MQLLRTAVAGCGLLLVVMALAGHAADLPASEQRKMAQKEGSCSMVQSGFEVSAISVLFAHPGEICAGRLETLQSCATTSAINKMQNKRRYYGFAHR